MASKLFVITLVVMLVGTACAMYDDDEMGTGDGYPLDGGYQMDQFLDELHPMLAIKRDSNRDKASKKYKSKSNALLNIQFGVPILLFHKGMKWGAARYVKC